LPVLITADFPPARGGIQRYVERLAEHLHARGACVAVVAPNGDGDARFDAERPYRVLRVRCPGERVTTLLHLIGGLLRARRTVPDAATIASSWYPAGLAAALVPSASRGRLAILAHGTELAPRGGALGTALRRWVFGRADVVVANSRFTARLARSAGVRAAVAVVHCGVEPAALRRSPAAMPTVLSVGRLVPRKGFDRTVEAIALLRERFPEVRYEIVGEGPDRKRLAALALSFGVAERVCFLGALDDAALRTAYERAWCFAMPARAEGGDVEGFGIVYLEAAMAGLPVVAGRGSGADEAVADGITGVLVDGSDARAVAAALGALLEAPRRAEAMGGAGRARALADFTWEATARKIASLTGLERDGAERCEGREAYA
jgi:phosphatidylinositol alpha-1,6-mannosyltransferase